MNIKLLHTSVFLSSILLVACNNEYSDSKSKEIHTKITKEIEADLNKEIAEAKLDTKDVSVDLIDGGQAVISANGDLSIAGKKIELSESQRALTKKYFAASKQLTIEGIEIGKESAKLATQAIGTAIGGLMSGDTDADFEKKMEAKTGDIEAAAQKICGTALKFEAIQKELIAAVPAFKVEPMRVDKQDDGCSVNSGTDVHINIGEELPAPPPPPAPPAPPEPPKAPNT
jgi:hypothetical protein